MGISVYLLEATAIACLPMVTFDAVCFGLSDDLRSKALALLSHLILKLKFPWYRQFQLARVQEECHLTSLIHTDLRLTKSTFRDEFPLVAFILPFSGFS